MLLDSLRNDIPDLIRIEDCLQKLMRYLPRSSRVLATVKDASAECRRDGEGAGGRSLEIDRSPSYFAIYPGALRKRNGELGRVIAL